MVSGRTHRRATSLVFERVQETSSSEGSGLDEPGRLTYTCSACQGGLHRLMLMGTDVVKE